MILSTNPPAHIIKRKKVLWIISKYLRFSPGMKTEVLNDMIGLKLLEVENKQGIKVINHKASENINKALLTTIMSTKIAMGANDNGNEGPVRKVLIVFL